MERVTLHTTTIGKYMAQYKTIPIEMKFLSYSYDFEAVFLRAVKKDNSYSQDVYST